MQIYGDSVQTEFRKREVKKMTIADRLETKGIRLSDCPFCGCKLSDFPLFMTVKPVHSEEYLMAKLERGHFLGGDNGYAVNCPYCGAAGGRDNIPEVACENWNRRSEYVRHSNLVDGDEENATD